MKRYENVDLTFIDNGNFIRDAVKLYNESVELWQKAKISETSNISEEKLYNQYQDAYEHYIQLHELLMKQKKMRLFYNTKHQRRIS